VIAVYVVGYLLVGSVFAVVYLRWLDPQPELEVQGFNVFLVFGWPIALLLTILALWAKAVQWLATVCKPRDGGGE